MFNLSLSVYMCTRVYELINEFYSNRNVCEAMMVKLVSWHFHYIAFVKVDIVHTIHTI